MKSVYLAAAAALAVTTAAPASAATIFLQDFSGSLGANESVFGNFTVNNGTVGHSGSYGDDEYSYYQLALDLTNYTSATLSFNYAINLESHFDRFNVLASTGGFTPPTGLISAVSGLTYTDEGDIHRPELGQIALADNASGLAVFDLSSFAGQTVNLRFQFGSDFSATSTGLNLDNISVVGDLAVGAVPEPATWAMMIAGFGAAGTALRRRRKVTTSVRFV